MPNDVIDTAVNEISAIADFVKTEVVEGALQVRDFALNAVSYESANIKPQFLQLVSDAMAAAEQSLAGQSGADKYAFAWSNAVAAAEKDAVGFAETAFDSCVQYVIAERNKRRASAALTALDTDPDHGNDPAPQVAA